MTTNIENVLTRLKMDLTNYSSYEYKHIIQEESLTFNPLNDGLQSIKVNDDLLNDISVDHDEFHFAFYEINTDNNDNNNNEKVIELDANLSIMINGASILKREDGLYGDVDMKQLLNYNTSGSVQQPLGTPFYMYKLDVHDLLLGYCLKTKIIKLHDRKYIDNIGSMILKINIFNSLNLFNNCTNQNKQIKMRIWIE
jgi:hypothetical protein